MLLSLNIFGSQDNFFARLKPAPVTGLQCVPLSETLLSSLQMQCLLWDSARSIIFIYLFAWKTVIDIVRMDLSCPLTLLRFLRWVFQPIRGCILSMFGALGQVKIRMFRMRQTALVINWYSSFAQKYLGDIIVWQSHFFILTWIQSIIGHFQPNAFSGPETVTWHWSIYMKNFKCIHEHLAALLWKWLWWEKVKDRSCNWGNGQGQ